MSRARNTKKRFGYLASATEPEADEPRTAERLTEEQSAPADTERAQETSRAEGPGGGGEGGRGRTTRRTRAQRKPAATELKSVPKGEGRMKQERSQLNVRIPTTLKRRASAKAVLEGKDIGEVVEDLLRRYLDR